MFGGAVAFAKNIMQGVATTISLVIDTIGALGGAIATFIELAPFLVALTPVALIAAWAAAGVAVKGTAAAAHGATIALNAAANAGQAAMAGVSGMANQAAGSVMGYAESIRGFANNVAATATSVFQSLWADIVTGFDNVVSDVGDSWKTIKALIGQGDFSAAWKVGVAIMQMEWVRFRNWFIDTWQQMIPSFNAAINNIASRVGDLIGNMQTDFSIAWNAMWDNVMAGIRQILAVLDKAIDSVLAMIDQVKAFMASLPGGGGDTGKGASRGPALQTLVPGAPSDDQVQARNDAARASGNATSDAIKDAAKGLAPMPEDPEAKARRTMDQVNAAKNLDIAKDAAKHQVDANQAAIDDKAKNDRKTAQAQRDAMVKGGGKDRAPGLSDKYNYDKDAEEQTKAAVAAEKQRGGGGGGGGGGGDNSTKKKKEKEEPKAAAQEAGKVGFQGLTELATKMQSEASAQNVGHQSLKEHKQANKHLDKIQQLISKQVGTSCSYCATITTSASNCSCPTPVTQQSVCVF